jgi:hypothetical protein
MYTIHGSPGARAIGTSSVVVVAATVVGAVELGSTGSVDSVATLSPVDG